MKSEVSKTHSYLDLNPSRPSPSDLLQPSNPLDLLKHSDVSKPPNPLEIPGPLASPDIIKSSDPLWFLDPRKVRAELAKTDPKTLLTQISQPSRPRWLDALTDWVSIHIPKDVFDRWNMRHEASHLSFEYNHKTEKMIIRVPTAIHESIPAIFNEQAAIMKGKLSRAAKNSIRIGASRRMSSLPILTKSLAKLTNA